MRVVVPWYGPLVEETARRHGLHPDLVGAIVLAESNALTSAYRYEPAYWLHYLANKPEWKYLNPHRVSASYGLMQVMFPTAVTNGLDATADPELLFLPTAGLEWGCRELERLVAWAGTFDAPPATRLRAAVAAYNGGQGGNEPTDATLRNFAYTWRVETRLDGMKFADLAS